VAAPFAAPRFRSDTPTPDTDDGRDDASNQIRQVATDYLEGFLTGDSMRAARGLNPGLSKKALRRGPAGEYFLESWGQGKHFHWTGVRQPDGTLPWGNDGKDPKLGITIMDHSGDIASVKIHSGYDVRGENPIQIDYLDCANLEGRWQAVNILCAGQRVSDGEWSTWW
jgi:Putative lumazine-binding